MIDFLANKKVSRGFVTLNHKTGEVSMGIEAPEISPDLMLDYECIRLYSNPGIESNRESLDQELQLEEAFELSKIDAAIVQTKRMIKRKTKVTRKLKSPNIEFTAPPPSPASSQEAEFV